MKLSSSCVGIAEFCNYHLTEKNWKTCYVCQKLTHTFVCESLKETHRQKVLYKKGVLNNLTKVTGQHLCGSLFFNNLAVNFATLFKTHLLHNTSEQLLLCVYHVQLKVLATLLLYNAAWKVSYSEFFWSVFSHIWTEYEEIRSISPYSVWMREITYQKNP